LSGRRCLCLALGWISLGLCVATSCGDEEKSPLLTVSPATVALYDDRGAWAESVTALQAMFQWMGCSVGRVSARQIRETGLWAYKIVCMPGGDMTEYSADLGSEGLDRIRQFVAGGGGYMGVCGGAYLAGTEVVWRGNRLRMECLGLYQGTGRGPEAAILPHGDYGMCTLRWEDRTHPVVEDLPELMSVLYYWGPVLLPDGPISGSILARYDRGGSPAALALTVGEGRVFLVGTHPEIEEDSDRDAVSFADEFDDEGSDWDLLRNAARWCLDGE